MNTYEQFLVEKMRKKSVTDVRKRKQWKEISQFIFQHFNNNREYFALSYCIFTNQNQVYVYISSTFKVVNVVNYIKYDLGDPSFSFTTVVIPLSS